MNRGSCGSALGLVCRLIFVAIACVTISTTAVSQPITAITGKCQCDTALNVTRCEYSIFVGEFPVRQVIVPIPAPCVTAVVATSPFFTISGPGEFKDPACGSNSGVLMIAERPVTKMAKTTFTYAGICSVGVVLAKVQTVDGECQSMPVPGVVDCVAEPYIAWRVDGVELEIAARKVGVYASQLLSMTAYSNTNSGITFSGFGDLLPAGDGPSIPFSLQVVEDCAPTPPASFLPPDQFNTLHLSIPGTEVPVQFCMWGRFEIVPEHPPAEYTRQAIIRLQMENQKVFVELSP